MNWKNVLRLISVDVKSSRLIRGSRFRRFRENKLVTYAMYVGACLLGVLIGWFIGNVYYAIPDPDLKQLLLQGATSLFISVPTLALLYGLVLTQMNQIQRIGAKVSIQPLYWLPITWKEHTLASILANMIGGPLVITIFISSSIAVASVFLGLGPLALFTILALLASVFLASVTTEIFKVLQVRLSGAVTRFTGRAAIWVRLVGSILFFIIIYLIYFSLYYNITPLTLLESVASGQNVLWFIPYVWLGMALSTFVQGLGLETAMFSVASLIFIYALFLAAVRMNIKFGLYEAPSIKISRGVYVSRAGLFGRLGFSPLEGAIIRKDLRAFTRRRELMYIFILPIIFVIMPLLSLMRSGAETPFASAMSSFLFAYLTLLPGTLMAVILGSSVVGSEGESVWYVHSSPVDAWSLVKAKYFFTVLFGLAVTSVCSIIGALLTLPSIHIAVISLAESILLIFSLGMISLAFGIRGADFRELPRPRMIRPLWSIINIIVCFALGVAIICPIIPYVLKMIFEAAEAGLTVPIWLTTSVSLPEYYPYVALLASGIIAAIVIYAFRKIAVKNAEELLARAEE